MPLVTGNPRDDAAALLVLAREALAIGFARSPELVEALHGELSRQLSDVAAGLRAEPSAETLQRALEIVDDATV